MTRCGVPVSYYQALATWPEERCIQLLLRFGELLARDGKSWTPQNSGAAVLLMGIWGTDATHLWTVGGELQSTDRGAILRLQP